MTAAPPSAVGLNMELFGILFTGLLLIRRDVISTIHIFGIPVQ